MSEKYKDGRAIKINNGFSHEITLNDGFIKVSGKGLTDREVRITDITSLGILANQFNIRNDTKEYPDGQLCVDIKSDSDVILTVEIDPELHEYEIKQLHGAKFTQNHIPLIDYDDYDW